MTTLRKISIGLGVFVVLSIIGGWIFLRPLIQMGTGYVAKQVCSCVYVGQRDFPNCYADLRRYGPRISARHLEELNGVRAEIFPVASATAYYHKGNGCTQE